MSLINVNITDPEEMEKPEYPVLEPGVYEFEITNDLSTRKSKNNPDGPLVIDVELKEVDTGIKVRDWLSLSPKMQWKLNKFTAIAGVAAEGGTADLADFKGAIVKARVKQRTFPKDDGTTGLSNNVTDYLI